MDEARRERSRHAVHDAAVRFAVATGDQRGAFGKLVFAHLAVEHQLIERRLHHRHRRGQLLEVDEPAAGIVGGRQEGRGRPAGPVGVVAPGDAAQIDGVEQERADVDVLAVSGGGDLLGDLTLGAAGRSPDHGRLPGLDEERQGVGKLARAGACSRRRWCRGRSWRAPGEWMSRPKRLWTIRPSPGPSPAFRSRRFGATGRLNGPGVGDEKAVSRPEGHAARRRRRQGSRHVCGRSCRRPERAHCHGKLAGLPGPSPTTGTSIPSSDAIGETSRKARTASPGASASTFHPSGAAEHVARCL